MTEQRNIKFATDLVTFYDTAFWGAAGGMDTLRNLFTSGGLGSGALLGTDS